MNVAYFILCALVFSVTLNIIYFSKKHINSKETKIFSILLFINLCGLIIEFFCSFIGNNFMANVEPAKLFTRIYLVYLMTYLLYMTLYIYVVCYASNQNEDISYYKKLRRLSYLIYFICILILVCLPIEVAAGYAVGPAVDFVYLCSSVCIGIWFIPIIKNAKRIDLKKFVPLFCFIFLIIIVAMIQRVNPQLTLITTMEFLIVFIMYHTIENPDTKILQELHHAKEISDNVNEEKTMFLYNMTNEIRQIIKDIDISVDNIINETNDTKADINMIEEQARDIKGSINKFTTMTNEILDISQVDINNIKIYKDKYNIKLIIKELVQMYKSRCINKNISFRSSVATDMPDYLYGDSVSLKKVLTILLDNSVHYTDYGYIEFNIDTIIKKDVCRLVITIEDSGKGMNAHELNKIFNTKKDNKDKYDLDSNVYNAKKLITLMGGTIIANSVYSEGTKMKIVLDQKIARVDSKLEKYEKIYDKKKILLVDDSEASGKIIIKMLSGTNVVLDIIDTGKEALDKIRNKEKYDLILLDEEMQPLDGITVMKKFQEVRTFNTKVVLLTRNNNYEYNEEYLKYGFSDYLLKPIDKDKLFKLINK